MRPLLVAALLLPTAAAAQRGVGVELGLRLGWASAVGDAARYVPMSEAVAWQVPIQAEVAWAAQRFAAGLYGSWAPAGAGAQGCTDGASCSAQVARAGFEGAWRFPALGFGAAPWLGGALGWEWASHRRERLGAETTTRWNGPELGLQGGLDWKLLGWSKTWWVGPYAQVGLGRYERMTLETAGAAASGGIADRAIHAWLQLGVRGAVDL